MHDPAGTNTDIMRGKHHVRCDDRGVHRRGKRPVIRPFPAFGSVVTNQHGTRRVKVTPRAATQLLHRLVGVEHQNALEKRLGVKEKETTQKGVVAVSGLLFVAGFVVAGLDFRFGWSNVPTWVMTVASVILLISYGLYAEVMRENAYLSRTVEVQENQKVIDTGLYGIVRHPMYAVTLWLFLSIPLVLGSWWALLCFAPYVLVIVIRIYNEEKVLTSGLEGYTEYKQRVKYRILPFIW